MSINSLCSNPQILDDLIDKLENILPTEPIQDLTNTDNNVLVSVVNTEIGIINLNTTLDVSGIVCNTYQGILTPSVKFNDNINIKGGANTTYSDISLNDTSIVISTNQNNHQMTLSDNFYLSNVQLKTGDMKNPFLTDGQAGQALSTNGNNSIIYTNFETTLTKFITVNSFNQTFNTNNTSLNLYTGSDIGGFTIGKKCVIDVLFTTYSSVSAPFYIDCVVNGNTQTINTTIGEVGVHTSYGALFQYTNTAEIQTVSINIRPTQGALFVDTGDSFNILIYEN